jgi:tetratricopeptide (TPR) repeat protein
MSGPARDLSESDFEPNQQPPVTPVGFGASQHPTETTEATDDDLAPTARVDFARVVLERVDVTQNTPPIPLTALPEPTGIAFPKAGTRLLHFELVEEISHGAFARVYLARQESLANRLVVLKVTTARSQEPQNLARLQHTNIVPVYSVHETEPFQVLCMPYLGRTTLVRALAWLVATGKIPETGQELLQVLGAGSATDHELMRMNYTDGCLWLIGQLAAALAHAHTRGILHRDIKPANILITDQGVPMILDFNVSSVAGKIDPLAPVGGTITYMAPEHLQAFVGESQPVDERSDLFSLGVILYELLSGESPFPATILPDELVTVCRMIAQRQIRPIPIRLRNPMVSPAVESIIQCLLEPSPEARYPSAKVLCEDIARQLTHRPLAFAPDRSIPEYVGKWRRRHPRLATGLAVAVAALLAVVLPTALIADREARITERTRLDRVAAATESADATIAALQTAAIHLGAQVEYASRNQGLQSARALIDQYGVTEPDWREQPDFTLLTPDKQAALTTAFAEVLVLMTRVEASSGQYSAEAINNALKWNALAALLFPPGEKPAVLVRHRTELEARLAGRSYPRATPPTNRNTDLYFDGLDLIAEHRHREALPRLVEFCELHPAHFRGWFARGACRAALGMWDDADTAFSVCVALVPDFPDVWLCRGIARCGLKRYAEAEADFSHALSLRENCIYTRLNRGIARLEQRKFRDAEADFTASLACPDAPTRLYFLRSLARRGGGNSTGADVDRTEGLKREPYDAISWATRGRWRMVGEPEMALVDFDAALKLDPTQRDSLVHKANVLANLLKRERDAIPVLDRLLELYPDNVDARASRGVYLARLGRSDAARRDATDSLAADPSAYRTYQVAGLYAQLAKVDPSAKDESLRLLAKALRSGFNDMKLLSEDTDIDPIRNDPEFQRLLDAAAQMTPRTGSGRERENGGTGERETKTP